MFTIFISFSFFIHRPSSHLHPFWLLPWPTLRVMLPSSMDMDMMDTATLSNMTLTKHINQLQDILTDQSKPINQPQLIPPQQQLPSQPQLPSPHQNTSQLQLMHQHQLTNQHHPILDQLIINPHTKNPLMMLMLNTTLNGK